MSERITVILADDEPPARLRMRSLLAAEPDIEIVAECESGSRALERVRILRPKLLLLDVRMPELDGFGLLRLLETTERPPAIVFVTAHDAYAVRAFEEAAIDYLLKPYTDERFAEAIARARRSIAGGDAGRRAIERLLAAGRRTERIDPIACRTREGVHLVDPREIDWIASDGNYALLHVGPATLRVREAFSELCERVAAAGVVRIHRTYAVNRDRVFRIEPWGSGEYLLVLRDGTKIQSSRRYGDAVRAIAR